MAVVPRLRPTPEPDQRGLWRDSGFVLFWAGSTVDTAGTQIRLVVLPVLVFQLTGSAAHTSVLLTLVLLPYLVFGLVAGAVADRTNRRLLMIGCDLVAAVAVASIPVAAAAGSLTLTHIYLTALLTGVTFVWHDAAQFGALPAIVGRARVSAAYGALISSDQVLNIAATALGGVLVATVGPATALWIDGASYALAALTLAVIPRPFGRASSSQPRESRLLLDIREGLRYVRRHRLIWPLTATGFGLGLTSGAVLGLLVVYGVRQLGLAVDDARLGWLFSASGIGALFAGLTLGPLARRVNQARITLLALAVNLVVLVGLALTTSLAAGLVLLLAYSVTNILIIANGIALRQQLTPDRLQGRVNVTARMIAAGGLPLGAAIGGVIAEYTSIRVSFLIMAFGVAASAGYAWSSALRTVDTAAIARLKDDADQAV